MEYLKGTSEYAYCEWNTNKELRNTHIVEWNTYKEPRNILTLEWNTYKEPRNMFFIEWNTCKEPRRILFVERNVDGTKEYNHHGMEYLKKTRSIRIVEWNTYRHYQMEDLP